MKLRIQKIREQSLIRPPGYLEEVLSSGTVFEEYLDITPADLARLREKYRPKPSPPRATASVPSNFTPFQQGPGTELKRLLARIGIEAIGQCQCNARAAEMNARGPDWCEQNIDVIVGWLREEATRRKLPFVPAAAKLLVRHVIKKARKPL